MLKRKVFIQLKEWKNDENKKCLVILGARQIGKTYAIREFAKENYDDVLEINFKETPSAKEIFSGDLTVETMISALRFRYPEKKIIPKKTLIFFDEIQECPEAITSLKFWTISRQYDVISSGSLLGIDYNRASSYPVGYVDYIKMFGLDFEEFLWARGISEEMVAQIKQFFVNRQVVPESINKTIMSYLREYIALGGMPEVLWNYVNTNDFRVADKIQREILLGYQYDIAHYATAEEKVKAEKCYLSLGTQLLNKENHKFQYKEVEKGGRAQKYFSSVEWLLRADIISLCRLVTDIRYDLNDYAREDFFRAYTTDLSLLVAMKDFGLKQHIVENTLEANTKGGIYECFVADALLKKNLPLFFYKNETTKKEIDFITQIDGKIIPIEVKSKNSKATSLNWVLENKISDSEKITAYKFIDGNLGIEKISGNKEIVSAPIYMSAFL